jgi:hypothetical protein
MLSSEVQSRRYRSCIPPSPPYAQLIHDLSADNGNPIDDKLRTNNHDQQTHDPRKDVHAGLPEFAREEWRSAKDHPGNQDNQQDCHVDAGALPNTLRLRFKCDYSCDCARPGEGWQAKWNDADVVLARTFRFFLFRCVYTGALGVQHFPANTEEDDAARDLERVCRDSEKFQNERAE